MYELEGDTTPYPLRPRYYRGPKGVAAYTSKPGPTGEYFVYFFRPTGPGARSLHPSKYKRVERLDTSRKSKSRAIDRAYELAYGKSRREPKPRQLVKENPGNTGYCMKQKKHVIVAQWSEVEAKNGRKMLTAPCPECGTKISKYGILKLCAECGKMAEARADDYLCKACRAEADA